MTHSNPPPLTECHAHKPLSGNQGHFSIQKTCFSIIWLFKDFFNATCSLSQSFWTTSLSTGPIINSKENTRVSGCVWPGGVKGQTLICLLKKKHNKTFIWNTNTAVPQPWKICKCSLVSAIEHKTSKASLICPPPQGWCSQVKDNLLKLSEVIS